MVQELSGGTRRVCEVLDEIEVPGPLLSHHLGVLREAGLVVATRRGRWVDYTLDQDALAELVTTVTTGTAGPVGARR